MYYTFYKALGNKTLQKQLLSAHQSAHFARILSGLLNLVLLSVTRLYALVTTQ